MSEANTSAEELAPTVPIPRLKLIVAALCGAGLGVVVWFVLKVYTGFLERYEAVGVPALAGAASLVPVWWCGGEQLRHGTYWQVLPVNAAISFLTIGTALVGDYATWWLADKAIIWDDVKATVCFAATIPLALGPYLWEYLARAARDKSQEGGKPS